MKSIAFRHCIGVFEGGGVRGAAFAGVYQAATEAEITFVGTVGTSAGSIAAALIAAGLPPDDVLNEMGKNFWSDLLEDAEPPPSIKARLLVESSRILGRRVHTAARWQLSLGLHSSEKLQRWLNEILRKQLPKANDPVQFGDLPKPLAVVAADLLARGPKIYSKKNTSGDSVSFAVRASCTLPFFFKPVESQGTYLVDGGILANLPVFLVSELDLAQNTPALCFRLTGERTSSAPLPDTGLELGTALLDTIINGVTEIQLNMGKNRQVINIPTGKIRTTDFDLKHDDIDLLIRSGRNSLRDFVENEQIHVTATSRPAPGPPLRGYREGLLQSTAEMISKSLGDIRIVAGDLSWLRELYITLLAARMMKRPVSLISTHSDKREYKEAMEGATALGAMIVESNRRPAVIGTIVSMDQDNAEMIVIEKRPEIHGRRYRAPDDGGMLRLFGEYFEQECAAGKCLTKGGSPTLQPVHVNDLIEALKKGVPQYKDLRVSVREVDVTRIDPLPLYLESFKLFRASQLNQLLEAHGLQNALWVQGAPWLVAPPVVERLHSGKLVMIDGAHRLYIARKEKQPKIRVILVENPEPNLPSTPFEGWDHIQIITEKKHRKERYRNYNDDNFREMRDAFNKLARNMIHGLA